MTRKDKIEALANIRQAIEAGNIGRLAAEVSRVIDKSKEMRQNWQSKYMRYLGDAPIKQRVYTIDGVTQTGKINRKLSYDFFGEIVDDKVGFMTGNGIKYRYTDQANEKAAATLSTFVKYADMLDLDSEAIKISAMCGVAYRLLWHLDGLPYASNVMPWDCVYLWQARDVAALLIYETAQGQRVDVYYGPYVYRFALSGWLGGELYDVTGNPVVAIDNKTPTAGTVGYLETIEHGFVGVPVIEFVNNEERQGDCDKVLDLIDQYDRICSDTYSEMEQFRLAYLAVFGTRLPDDKQKVQEMMDMIRQTGMFVLEPTPQNPGGGSVQFVTKNMDVNIVKFLMEALEDKIYRFAKAINYGRDAISGSVATGVALKQRLQQIRHKCLTTWRKTETALREQWRIIAGFWQAQGIPVDYLMIDQDIVLSIPVDVREEAELLTVLDGKVSRRTALSQISFIDSVDDEIMAMEAEGLIDSIVPTAADIDEARQAVSENTGDEVR